MTTYLVQFNMLDGSKHYVEYDGINDLQAREWAYQYASKTFGQLPERINIWMDANDATQMLFDRMTELMEEVTSR